MEKREAYFKSDIKVRSEQDGKKYLEGYFIRFNQETELWKDTYEVIAPGAANKSLRENDIRVLFNHDSAIVLARTGNNTATLRADATGVWGSIEINPNDQQANDIHARVERGDINGCSFGFFPTDEKRLEQEDGSVKYVVKEADIIEVSVVTFPAYPQTQIEARAKADKNYRRKEFERKKRNALAKFKKGENNE